MKSIIRTACLAIAAMAVFSSCKKDDDKSKTELLTSGAWKVSAAHERVNGGAWDDITDTEFEPCTLDNTIRFTEPNVITTDEGATKCDPADPQTETGTWQFINDGQDILLDGELFDLDELTGSTLRVSVTESFGGQTYTLRITFTR